MNIPTRVQHNQNMYFIPTSYLATWVTDEKCGLDYQNGQVWIQRQTSHKNIIVCLEQDYDVDSLPDTNCLYCSVSQSVLQSMSTRDQWLESTMCMGAGYYKIVMLSIYIIASTHLLYNVNNTI